MAELSAQSFMQSEGILDANEPYETVYLNDDEIEKFMEKYLLENPGTEVETRYINRSPVNLTQNIEVRWLRPITPEIPPIIIKEVDIVEKGEPPLKIVQKKPAQAEEKKELIIREKPMPLKMPEAKVIYVPVEQTTGKEQLKSPKNKEIKIEHVRSDSQSNYNSRLEYDDHVFEKKAAPFSFEEHASIVDYEEEFEHRHSTIEEYNDEPYRYKKRSLHEEQELKMYEEKLMQTLYEEYLLKLEREKLERKLTSSGVFEERLRERSMSQERHMSHNERLSQNRFSQSRFSHSQVRINEEQLLRDEEIRLQRARDEEARLREQRQREEDLYARYFAPSKASRVRISEEHPLQRDEDIRLQRVREERYKDKVIKEEEMRLNRLREQQQQQVSSSQSFTNSIVNKGPSDGSTSTYKSIKFSKVSDENELRRWNNLLNSASSVQNNVETEKTLSSIAQVASNPNSYSATNLESKNRFNSSSADYYNMKSAYEVKR